MYGIVNRAIEQLVRAQAGEAGWQRVCLRAGTGSDGFVAMCPYHDDATYRLVAAVGEELGLPPEQVLEAFGEYWVLYTVDEGYGEFLDASGTTVREVLGNLDEMHGRIETLFSQMQLPRFRVEDLGPAEYRLHYHSERPGLGPMVLGLVRGLAKRCGESVQVTLESARGPGQPADRFIVRRLAA